MAATDATMLCPAFVIYTVHIYVAQNFRVDGVAGPVFMRRFGLFLRQCILTKTNLFLLHMVI